MTAPDHTTKPLENILRERGHPFMDTCLTTAKILAANQEHRMTK